MSGFSDPRDAPGPVHGPYESAEHFLERTKSQREAPSWAQLRARSDHADKAYEFLSSAPFHGDAEMAKVMVDAATVHATLALTDKVEELVQTLKHVSGQVVESNERLNENVKMAADHLHADAQSLQRHLQVVRDGEAA